MSEFKEFVMRGNVMDLAVGVIIGAAFGDIVNSLCNDVILPAVSWLIGVATGMDFTNPETGKLDFSKATEAMNVGPIAFGKFAAAIINFLIMAIIIFAMVKAVNKLTSLAKKPVEEKVTTKKCPFCLSEIDISATRCAHCTSVLEIAEEALEDKKEEPPADEEKPKGKKGKK